MKCIRRQMAEAIHVSTDNWIEAIRFVAERKELTDHYGRKIGDIQRDARLGRFPTDGYFVFDNGTMDYLTEDEFSEMYKPCPGLWHD